MIATYIVCQWCGKEEVVRSDPSFNPPEGSTWHAVVPEQWSQPSYDRRDEPSSIWHIWHICPKCYKERLKPE